MSITVEKIVLGDISTNTYIVTVGDECVVIDPAVDSELLKAKLDGKNVKYILLTHGHFDHISGVKAVKDLTGAKIVIHSEDAECLENSEKSLFSWEYPDKVQPVMHADITVSNGDTLSIGGQTVTIMHTPGHTVGSCCYIFNDDHVIFSGDTLFYLSAGRTDFPGGSAREILYSLSRLAELQDDYKVFPGHDRETTLEFERKNNRYMRRRYAPAGN